LPEPEHALVIWRLTDGKPGHDNQSRGLCQALTRLHSTQIFDIPTHDSLPGLFNLLNKRFPAASQLPDPALIIGAGHATHTLMLLARRARGGRCVVLMKPSLPLALFDLCLIPEHDRVNPRNNVLLTRGALNTIRCAENARTDRGLILIGGPSAHHGWHEDEILNAVISIVQKCHHLHWHITDSRRTPDTTRDKLRRLNNVNLSFTPAEQTPQGWVAEQLAESSQVWVSADSVSMIYEALTAGAATGLLEVPVNRADRITRGVGKLLAEQQLTGFSAWQQGQQLTRPSAQLAEADRCAREISQRWLH
jgi:hypothetical protein